MRRHITNRPSRRCVELWRFAVASVPARLGSNVRTMKNTLLIISGALIPISLAGLAFVYIKITLQQNIWSHENRNMLYESYSPQKQHKVGVYNYDKGALGYTAVQVSIVEAEDKYPISGNLLRDQYIEPVKWVSENTAELPIKQKNNAKAKLIVTME